MIQTIVEADLGVDTASICIGENYTFDAGSGYQSYLWQNGSTGQTFTASQTGVYWCEVGIGNCVDTDSAFLYVDDPTIGFTLGPLILQSVQAPK
ncbi:MAG: hypothetical protein R2759_04700 [Bacteroidales bacterium]